MVPAPQVKKMDKAKYEKMESALKVIQNEDTCDDCDAQEGQHYCLLHSKMIKNMDLKRCDDFIRRRE
jgi:hypothetical protein